jgi:hypothetical protein
LNPAVQEGVEVAKVEEVKHAHHEDADVVARKEELLKL